MGAKWLDPLPGSCCEGPLALSSFILHRSCHSTICWTWPILLLLWAVPVQHPATFACAVSHHFSKGPKGQKKALVRSSKGCLMKEYERGPSSPKHLFLFSCSFFLSLFFLEGVIGCSLLFCPEKARLTVSDQFSPAALVEESGR